MSVALADEPPPTRGGACPPSCSRARRSASPPPRPLLPAPTGIHNPVFIAVLYGGGLRVSEALNLLPKDVPPERGRSGEEFGARRGPVASSAAARWAS